MLNYEDKRMCVRMHVRICT